MQSKTRMMSFRINSQTAKEFLIACKINDTSATAEIVAFIQEYVKKHSKINKIDNKSGS